MSLPSPHRGMPHARIAFPAAVLGIAILLAGAPSPFARTGEHRLPGRIPQSPPLVAGFPIGFPQTTDYRPREGAVVAAQIEGRGVTDLVVSVPAGVITVLRPDGTRLPGWPRTFEARPDRPYPFGPLPQPAYPFGAPGVGDIDGDGAPEIVTCVVAGIAPRRNFLFAFRADGGDQPGWPIEVQHQSTGTDFYSCSPAGVLMADLDGDGRMEVVRGMNQGEVQAIDGDGRPHDRWPFRLGADAYGRPRAINADLAAADLDGDGRDEVIFAESGFEPRLVAVSGRGQVLDGFPRRLASIIDRQAPAVGDLDGDGVPEVVQTTLPYSGDLLHAGLDGGGPGPWSRDLQGRVSPGGIGSGGAPMIPAQIFVLGSDGSELNGWPRTLENGGPWGAVLADLDDDRAPEILQQDGGLLYAFDVRGGVVPGFPLRIHRDFLRSQWTEESPWLVTDLDGDRRMELIQARSDIYSGSSYLRVFGMRATGQPLRGFPFEVAGLLAASPPVAVDLNGDGVRDLAMLTMWGTSGGWRLMAWDLGAPGHGRL